MKVICEEIFLLRLICNKLPVKEIEVFCHQLIILSSYK